MFFRNKTHPNVMGACEVRGFCSHLSGTQAIMATLLYGSGLRLMECHRLRVKDIDVEQRQIVKYRTGQWVWMILQAIALPIRSLRAERDDLRKPPGMVVSGGIVLAAWVSEQNPVIAHLSKDAVAFEYALQPGGVIPLGFSGSTPNEGPLASDCWITGGKEGRLMGG